MLPFTYELTNVTSTLLYCSIISCLPREEITQVDKSKIEAHQDTPSDDELFLNIHTHQKNTILLPTFIVLVPSDLIP